MILTNRLTFFRKWSISTSRFWYAITFKVLLFRLVCKGNIFYNLTKNIKVLKAKLCPKIHQIAPFFSSKKIPGVGGGYPPPRTPSLASPSVLAGKYFMFQIWWKRFVLYYMLEGKREAPIISYKQILCQVKAFNGSLVTDKINYRIGQWRSNISFVTIFCMHRNMRLMFWVLKRTVSLRRFFWVPTI